MLPPVDSEDVSMHISLPTHLNSYREALGMLIQVSVRIAYEEEVIDCVFLSTPFFHESVVNLLNLWVLGCKDLKLGSVLSAYKYTL